MQSLKISSRENFQHCKINKWPSPLSHNTLSNNESERNDIYCLVIHKGEYAMILYVCKSSLVDFVNV